MIDNQPLHKVQFLILDALRHKQAARFSDLMQPTGLTSDTFKFHIRKLVSAGIVEKLETGEYQLTLRGKEIANTINRSTRATQKQSKLSVILIVSQQNADGEAEYLVQQRQRNPYYHYWGFPTGPLHWGEEPETSAQRELEKQTGMHADFTARAFYRERDYDADTDVLLEDKLFTIMSTENATGILTDGNSGHNVWMSLRQLVEQEHYFSSCSEIVTMLASKQTYLSRTVSHSPDLY